MKEQTKMSEFERSLLMQEMEDKDEEIRCSASRVENLEESISSMALEYQCEIESIKLDASTLEHNLFETKKLLEEKTQENSTLNGLIEDLEARNQDTYQVIERLWKENNDLTEKLQISDLSVRAFVKDVEEQLHGWLPEVEGQPSSKLMKYTRYAYPVRICAASYTFVVPFLECACDWNNQVSNYILCVHYVLAIIVLCNCNCNCNDLHIYMFNILGLKLQLQHIWQCLGPALL